MFEHKECTLMDLQVVSYVKLPFQQSLNIMVPVTPLLTLIWYIWKLSWVDDDILIEYYLLYFQGLWIIDMLMHKYLMCILYI